MADQQPTAPPVKPAPDRAARRKRQTTLWVVTLVAATLGIVLVAAVGPILFNKSKTPPSSTSISAQQQSEVYQQQAETALAAGETTAAIALAQQAVQADPNNAAARQVLSRASAAAVTASGGSGSSSSQGSSATTKPVSPDAGYTKAIKDLVSLLPSSAPGFSFESTVVMGPSASISASPEKAGATGRYIWTVRDLKSTSSAHSFIKRTTKELYGKNSATVKVHGVSAYYGTDGGQIATVTYSRGRFVFELLYPKSAGRATGVSAASKFGDTPIP